MHIPLNGMLPHMSPWVAAASWLHPFVSRQHTTLLLPALPPLQVNYHGFGNDGNSGVAVLLPAGTYRITQTLEISQSNVVVRGAGVGAAGAAAAGAWIAECAIMVLPCCFPFLPARHLRPGLLAHILAAPPAWSAPTRHSP